MFALLVYGWLGIAGMASSNMLHFDREFSVDSIIPAQFDTDPTTGKALQHMPLYRGEKAPYDGILMDGSRYATLKLAELRMTIMKKQLDSFELSYAELERYAGQCRAQLALGCPLPPPCPSPPFWETSEFWFGVLVGGVVATSIMLLIVEL